MNDVGEYVDQRLSGELKGPVGRDTELTLIRDFLERAAEDGAALVLSGEPGVGKTVLLEAAARAAAGCGTRVLRVAGVEFEADIAFSGLNQLLFPVYQDHVDRLSLAQRSALSLALGFGEGTMADRLTVSTAALTLLRQVAEDCPLLIVVDDLHWLDRSSAGVLGFMARRLAGSRVGLIAASRLGPDTFFDRGGLPEHEVRPLDGAAADGLLGVRFPGLAEPVRRRVIAEAQGNPLVLVELPQVLSDLQRAGDEALPEVLPLSQRLQTLFTSRIADLPARTCRLLLLAALDSTGDLGVLEAATGGCLEELGPAERAGLAGVDLATRRLIFRHPVVRSTVVNFFTEAERRRARRALADALADQPERQAWQLADATIGADERVAALLEQVSRRALRCGDAAGAVAALLRAADLSPRSADRSRRLAEAAYVGANVTGGLRDVPRLLVDARRADPGLDRSLEAAVATAYLLINGEGDADTAYRLLMGAIEARGGELRADDHALVEALFTMLLVCFSAGPRPELWEPFQAIVARLTPRPPEVLAVCTAIFADPAHATPATLAELDDLISRFPEEADQDRIVWIGRSGFFYDRMQCCREALWRVVRDGRDGGAVTSAIGALISLSLDDLLIGQWDESAQLAEEGLRLCRRHGYLLLEWPLWFVQAILAAQRGDEETALALADKMVRWGTPRRAGKVLFYARYVRALAALGRGDAEAAYQDLASISPPGVLARYVPLVMWAAPVLVEAAVGSGRPAEARRHVAAMREAGFTDMSARLALAVEGAAAVSAPAAEADARFERALAVPGAERWPFDLARIRLAYGEHCRRTRAIHRARTQLAQALETFERLGARPWAERARNELRATGQSPPHEGLTPQERQIAHLAATGLTNKQIAQRLHLSPRTISAHLYRVFPKLGITSRAALRDALGDKLNRDDVAF
ncbi:helix-turn-helix transcriptional regulator [Nonomuraea terrae]|uniref:Helix-turn-helix transcriptional regulator n=1 Tax=Nonomuraea terrae TaxID=2530383 RepID=A0A4R4YP23_9ACTN|nr:LuxR family transcriptional regulator [Nonomuraea terrae]TDD46024.1 helix-turn-helix transcriptional regulator [Nonomuraea terrae]